MNLFGSKKNEISEEEVKEFYERSQRSKEDKAWLDKIKPLFRQHFLLPKNLVGDYVVSSVVPDESKFNMDLVKEHIKNKYPEVYLSVIKEEIDETKLEAAIELEQIDITELKKVAWVEKKGTPRISVGIKNDKS
jgi:hypothetical protein